MLPDHPYEHALLCVAMLHPEHGEIAPAKPHRIAGPPSGFDQGLLRAASANSSLSHTLHMIVRAGPVKIGRWVQSNPLNFWSTVECLVEYKQVPYLSSASGEM